MKGQLSEGMSFKEFCVSSVDLGFENPSERMEEGGVNIEGVIHGVPSNEEVGQSQGLTSTNNEGMKRYWSIQDLYKATNPIEDKCLILFEEPTTYSKASQEEAWKKAMEKEIASSRRRIRGR